MLLSGNHCKCVCRHVCFGYESVCVSVWSFHLSLQAAAPSLKHVDKMQLMKQFWISQSQRCTCCPLLTSSSLSFSSASPPPVHHLLLSLLTSMPPSPHHLHSCLTLWNGMSSALSHCPAEIYFYILKTLRGFYAGASDRWYCNIAAGCNEVRHCID